MHLESVIYLMLLRLGNNSFFNARTENKALLTKDCRYKVILILQSKQ